MTAFEITTISQQPLTDDAVAHAARLEHRAELLKELGATAQASATKLEIATVKARARIVAEPLSPEEIVIWKAWLPTAYSTNTDGWRNMKNYAFDRIPMPVVEQWKRHKESGLFDAFEIWTPEDSVVVDDPILVGVAGNNRYLLARWGETDANLVTFADIKAALKKREYRKFWTNDMLIVSSIVIGACVYLLAQLPVEALDRLGYIESVSAMGILLGTIFTVSGIGAWVYHMHQKMLAAPFWQALKRDDARRTQEVRAMT